MRWIRCGHGEAVLIGGEGQAVLAVTIHNLRKASQVRPVRAENKFQMHYLKDTFNALFKIACQSSETH